MLITALSCSSFAAGTQASLIQNMEKKELTFNDLPMVVAGLRDEVAGMKVLLSDLQKGQTQQSVQRTRRTMNVEEAADYLRMPLNTLYQKLQKGEVPGSKPGKRWVLYSDELDKYLEVNRRNSVPMTAEEQNEAILASHRRKPVKSDWRKEHECKTPKTEQV
jgi:excisionase family DNA binding protein